MGQGLGGVANGQGLEPLLTSLSSQVNQLEERSDDLSFRPENPGLAELRLAGWRGTAGAASAVPDVAS